ncbi:hypothetical protein OSTOST_17310, partial [Ostertagia ostertagi]
EEFESTGDKRALSSFDTLGGIGLGKRAHLSTIDSLGGLGSNTYNSYFLKNSLGDWFHVLVSRRLALYDTLGDRLRTRNRDKKALSSFDTLGDKCANSGIGLGKRYDVMNGEKKSVSSFDTLAGIGLGKRAGYFTPVGFSMNLL